MENDLTPTIETRPSQLCIDGVTTFLASHFGEVDRVVRVGQGEWSTAFAFRRGGDDFVVRFGAHRDDFDKDRSAAAFASTNLPIPEVFEIGTAFGGFYAISERAFGTHLDDLDGEQMKAHLPSILAMLDAIREVDLRNSTGYGAWNADGAGSQPSWRSALLAVGEDRPSDRTFGWREKLRNSEVGIEPFEEALGHLGSLVEVAPGARHLVHSDLFNNNVLVRNGRISAVIDWGCGLYGDFLYDVAWFAFWAPWCPAWNGIDFVGAASDHYAEIGLSVPNFAERIRCYQIHIGLAGLAYRAFKEDWSEVELRGKRTLAIATQRA